MSEEKLIHSWEFIAALIVMTFLVLFSLWKTRNAANSLASVITRFKFMSLAYCVFFFALALSLPSTGIWMYREPYELQSLEEAARRQRELGLDLHRLREIAFWFLFMMVFWFMNIFFY